MVEPGLRSPPRRGDVPVSERLAWAAGVVAPRPREQMLEVGCGHGVLVSLLSGRGCDVLGVDRSPTMVMAAGRRDRAGIEAGRVRLQAAALSEADLGPDPLDVVVSFDARAFHDPAQQARRDVVDRVLASAGRVIVAISVMTPGADAAVDTVCRLAADHGRAVAAVHHGATAPMASAAVELRRAG